MLLDKLKDYKVYLASKSPRRHEMLGSMAIDFEYLPTQVDEFHPEGYSPVQVAEFLSQHKLSPVPMDEYPANALFIACDTIVVVDNQILEKPKDREDALRMLRTLSGREHLVISGLTVCNRAKQLTSHRSTRVRFKQFSEAELTYYVDNYYPMDKAGAYGIQEWIGYTGINYIEGSFFNVMGLPTQLLWEMLSEIVEVPAN